MTSSKLAVINQLRQNIHNLKMRWPCGIKSVDDKYDEKLKRLEALLRDIEPSLPKRPDPRALRAIMDAPSSASSALPSAPED